MSVSQSTIHKHSPTRERKKNKDIGGTCDMIPTVHSVLCESVLSVKSDVSCRQKHPCPSSKHKRKREL